MSTVNIDLSSDTQLNMILGQQDETEVREVVFDFSGWYTTYGSGTISLSVQRSKDEWPYEVELTVDSTNHTATWTITDTDTGYAGVGMVQITYTVGTAKKKSVVYRFTVYKSLGATGNVITPVQLQTWMDEVDQELTDIKQDLQNAGMSEDFKQALHDILEKVAYIDEDGQDYLDALDDAMWPPTPPATLTSITCVYTQSGTVYDTDTLDSLKTDLVVTAHYDNSTSQVVTSYTLSGTLAEGTSTITVSYNGKTTTFNVTVTQVDIIEWDISKGRVPSTDDGIITTNGGNYTEAFDSTNGLVITGTSSNNLKYDVADYQYLKKGTWEATFTIVSMSNNAHIDCRLTSDGTNGCNLYFGKRGQGERSLRYFFNSDSNTYYQDNVWDLNQEYTVKVDFDYNANGKTIIYLNGEKWYETSTPSSYYASSNRMMFVGTMKVYVKSFKWSIKEGVLNE